VSTENDTNPTLEERRREPWPWIVTGLLAFMITTSLLFYAIAAANPDPPVTPESKPGLSAS
jgi:hypothetical protein